MYKFLLASPVPFRTKHLSRGKSAERPKYSLKTVRSKPSHSLGDLHARQEFGVIGLDVEEWVLLEDMIGRLLLLLAVSAVCVCSGLFWSLHHRSVFCGRCLVYLDLFRCLFGSFRCRRGDGTFLCRGRDIRRLWGGRGSGSLDNTDVEAAGVLIVWQQSETILGSAQSTAQSDKRTHVPSPALSHSPVPIKSRPKPCPDR